MDLQTWCECWAVYKVAVIGEGWCTAGVLDRYRARFEERARSYPHHWSLLALIDARARTEKAEDLRIEAELLHDQFRSHRTSTLCILGSTCYCH